MFTTVYAGLRINLCLVLAASPMTVALAFTSEPLKAWPFFVLLSAVCGPAAAATFAVFEHRTSFWCGYRSAFARSLTVAGAAATCVVVLGFDLQQAVGTRFAAVTPVLAVLLALVTAVTTVMLAAGWRLSGRGVLAAAYLSIRKWHLTLANTAVLSVLLAAIVAKPVVGLFVLPAPALYVVWANARHMLSPSHL